jgi:hypothetical protein
MLIAPDFYNTADQNIYNQGYSFIPQERFRGGAFNIPTPDSATGITTLPTAMNMGGSRDQGGFNPYNTDMSTIRQDYNAFPSRQAGEIYSKTFNPQSFDPSGQINIAQNLYNKALGDIDAKGLNARTQTFTQTRPSQEVLDFYGEKILDNQEKYRTQGQFVDPYDPNYSSMTEAQKFMDNYPDYYGVPSGVPEKGIPAAIKSYMQNSLLGKAANFIGGLMPINERAIMENEARGAGIFTDDIGRIVTDDYNTAGGIMAGYNLNQIDESTFDKRRDTINKTIADKKAKGLDTTVLEERLDLLDKAEEDILKARKKTQQIYKMKTDKKAADKKRKEAAAAAKAKAKALAAIKKQGQADYNPNIHGPTNYGQDSQGNQSFDFGQGFGIGSDGGPVSNKTGRGRTGFMGGGLTNLVDIYD